ncbi:MAG: HEAT repeat domain-containing protein [Bradymonadaceae bacterium]|nr:HEAT repeat domain-containing protein [Lujinxingiaceae bacterium]
MSQPSRMARRLIAIEAALVFSLGFATAHSQETAYAPGTDHGDTVRYEQLVTIARGRAPVTVSLSRSDDGQRDAWTLRAVSDDVAATRLCLATLPPYAGMRYYNYRISVDSIGRDAHLLLFEAKSSVDEGAPPDMATLQVAWLLRPTASRSGWTCTLLAKGEFTELDGGARLHIDRQAKPPQLIRADAATTVQFCGLADGEDRALEVYDVERQRFTPQAKVEVLLENATRLTARLPETRFQAPFLSSIYSWAWATSDFRGAAGTSVAIRPLTLGDLDLSTVWVAGGQGLGRGEYVTASINELVALQGFRIFPGHGGSARQSREHGRPTQILVSFSDLSRYVVDLPAAEFSDLIETGGFYVSLPEPVKTRCMTVMLLDGRPGSVRPQRGLPDTRQAIAIAEITPHSVLDAPSAGESAQNLLERIASEPDARKRERLGMLMSLIPDEALATIRQAIIDGPAERRVRVIPLLGQLPTESAVAVLVAAFEVVSTDAPEYRAIMRTMAVHGAASVGGLLAILKADEISERKHVDTIRLVGRIGTPDQIATLVADLGKGGDFTRRERVRAVANGGDAIVPSVLARAHASSDPATTYDALMVLDTMGRRISVREDRQIEGSQLLIDIVQSAPSRGHMLAAIRSLGYFRSPGAMPFLAELLAGRRDPLVRRTAAEALAHYPDEEARLALESALQDSSPDVRIAAVSGLAVRDDAEQSVAAVIDYARVETWSQGLHNAYGMLALRERPEAAAYLAEVVATQIRTQRAIIAMRALRRADRALDPGLVDTLLRSETTPYAARRQLVDLLGLDRSPTGEALLLALVNEDLNRIGDLTDEQQEVLYRNGLMALGHRRSEVGIDVLMDVLQNEPEIERRQIALRSLSFYADEQVVNLLQAWSTKAPAELRDQLLETIGTVRNRINIRDAGEDIESLIESLDEAEEP